MKTVNLFVLTIMSIIMGIVNTSCSDEEELSKISFLEGTSLKMTIGSTETLHLVGEPSSIELPLCEWNSNNTEVLSVNSQGQITAKNVGNATVTASTKSGLIATCSVIVDPVNVTGIKLSEESKNIQVGESVSITAEVVPSNATYPVLVWSSSDNNIASVDNGKITAVGVGSCQIIVEDEKKNAKSICEIVVSPVEMENIVFTATSVEVELNRSLTLEYTIEPINTTDPELIWESSNTDIATIENGTINAHSLGTCVISATNKDKTVKADCSVTVIPVKVSSISTTLRTEQQWAIGAKQNLSSYISVEPQDAEANTLIWTSSNPNVLSVDNSGTIEGKSKGNATIKIETPDGKCSLSLSFTVKDITDLIVMNVNHNNGTWMQIGSTIVAAEFYLNAKVYNDYNWNIKITDFYLLNKYSGTIVPARNDNDWLAFASRRYGPVKINNNYSTTDPYLDYYYWICKYTYNGKEYEITKKAF